MRLLNRLLGRKLSLALILRPGDMFCVQTGNWLGKAIRWAEGLLHDPGTYNHAGIIVDANGDTLEANWHFDYSKLSDYIGCKILIVRDLGMTPEAFQKGMDAVTPDIGNLYPWWRLLLFLIGLDKYFKGGQGVCSEETAKFWNATGLYKISHFIRGANRTIKTWRTIKRIKRLRTRYGGQVYGLTPDDLALAFKKEIADKKMIAVYDGVL